MKRKMMIEYEGKPVNMDMLDTVLGCFNQDITIREARHLINLGGAKNEKMS